MNKIIIAIMPWLFAAIGYKAAAQDVEKKVEETKKESQEIIISKKGDKNTTVTIEFKDDKVIVNGKPLIEFKDDAITIHNRKIMIKELNRKMMDNMENRFKNFEFSFDDEHGGMMAPSASKTFLGVSTEKTTNGALVKEVTKGSAAEKAGLKAGDIITKIDDKKVDGPEMLADLITAKKPKEDVKVFYKRDGKDKSVKATLGERSESNMRSFKFISPDGNAKAFTIPRTPAAPRMPGMEGMMAPRTFEWNGENMEGMLFGSRQKLGIKIQDIEEGAGVKILDVEKGSAAETAGLKKDDIITEIGGAKINNTDDAREQLHKNAEVNNYSVSAKRNNAVMKFEVKIPKKLKTANL